MKALALSLVAVSGVAAADTYPLSAIQTKPVVGASDGSETEWPCAMDTSELRDASWTRGDDTLVHDDPSPAATFTSASGYIGRERLVVGKAGAELERARDGELGRIPLHVVAHVTDGLDVYAYRGNALDAEQPTPAVFLVVAFPTGVASLDSLLVDEGALSVRAFACGVSETVLRVVNGNSRLGEIVGRLPDGRSFVVSASVTKTSRDREPILSVVVHRIGDSAVNR
jgi:hypothetical protein